MNLVNNEYKEKEKKKGMLWQGLNGSQNFYGRKKNFLLILLKLNKRWVFFCLPHRNNFLGQLNKQLYYSTFIII
jgi:hypothetical protein